MKHLRDVIILAIGRGVLVLASIISIRVYTSLLSRAEVGRYSLLSALGTGVTLILISPVGMYINRRLLEWGREGTARRHLLSYGRYLLLVTGIAVALLVLVKTAAGIGIQVSTPWLIVAVVGTVLISTLNNTVVTSINLLGHRLCFATLANLSAWIGLGVSTMLATTVRADAEHWLLGVIVGQIPIVVLGSAILARLFRARIQSVIRPDPTSFSVPVVWSFAWPLVISTGLYWVQTQGYRFVLNDVAGLESVGVFTVGFTIGVSLTAVFDSLFTQFYHPVFYGEIAHGNAEAQAQAWNRYARAFFPALVLMSAFVGGMGSYFARIFTGEDFRAAGSVVAWGVLAESLRQVTTMLSLVAHARVDMKRLITPSLIGVGVSLCGVHLLGATDPLNGTGFALAAGGTAWVALLVVQMRRLLPQISFPSVTIVLASLLAVPLILSSFLIDSIWSKISTATALFVVGVGSIYMLGTQLLLACSWLTERPSPALASSDLLRPPDVSPGEG